MRNLCAPDAPPSDAPHNARRYGYGDAEKPNAESVALVEKLVVQRGPGAPRALPRSSVDRAPRRRYVQTLCADAESVARLRGRKLDTGCFLLSIQHQTHKYLRAQDLLAAKARLKEVRRIDPLTAGD